MSKWLWNDGDTRCGPHPAMAIPNRPTTNTPGRGLTVTDSTPSISTRHARRRMVGQTMDSPLQGTLGSTDGTGSSVHWSPSVVIPALVSILLAIHGRPLASMHGSPDTPPLGAWRGLAWLGSMRRRRCPGCPVEMVDHGPVRSRQRSSGIAGASASRSGSVILTQWSPSIVASTASPEPRSVVIR